MAHPGQAALDAIIAAQNPPNRMHDQPAPLVIVAEPLATADRLLNEMLEVLKRIGHGIASAELEDRRLTRDDAWAMLSAIMRVVAKVENKTL